MAHDPNLLDYLESLPRTQWKGSVFRFTAGGIPPDRVNTLGARWNRKNDHAIYTALERETALAELRHSLAMNSPRPSRGRFRMYSIRIAVGSVVDLAATDRLAGVGLNPLLVGADDYSKCQAVGSAARFLNIGGLLVGSARREGGTNLVIFPDICVDEFEFDVEAEEPLAVGEPPLI